MPTLFILTLAYGVFTLLNLMRIANETTKLKTRLSSLDSRLHLLVVNREVDPEDKSYYFVKGLLNSSFILRYINFWTIIYIAFKTRKKDDASYLEFERENFSHNQKLKNILHECTKASVKYFNSKNIFSITLFRYTIKGIRIFTSIFNRTRGETFTSNLKRKFKFILLHQEIEYLSHHSSSAPQSVYAEMAC